MTYSENDRVIVAIDGDNFSATLQKLAEDLGRKIDLVEVIKFVINGSRPVDIFMYVSVEDDGSWPAGMHGYANALRQQGVRVVPVPKVIVGTNEINRPIRKGYEDLEVMLEILEYQENQYDRLVLFAGDSDFARFIKILRKRGIRVEVVTQNINTNDWLLKEVHRYYNLRELIRDHPEFFRS